MSQSYEDVMYVAWQFFSFRGLGLRRDLQAQHAERVASTAGRMMTSEIGWWTKDFRTLWSCFRVSTLEFRVHLICTDPIPEWQSRIGMRCILYEHCDAVYTIVFGIDFFCKDFRPNKSMITRMACGCDLHVFTPTSVIGRLN